MRKSLNIVLALVAIFVLLLSACAPATQAPTQEPANPEPTEPATEAPTEAPAEATATTESAGGEIGSAEHPIKVLFVPSVDANVIVPGGEIMAQALNEEYESEMERGTSPCLRLVDTKIVKEDGEHFLCMNVYFRSWDCYGGWPENMGGLALLQEYMAAELGIKMGTLSFTSKGLHAYDFQLEALKGRIGA